MNGRCQQQLSLQVQLRDQATLENFLAGPQTRPLIGALQQQLEASGEAIIYLYGPSGSGKSHLLQASCHLAGARSLYLALNELGEFDPEEVLQGIERLELVCLDDVHRVLGSSEWEVALFNLCNRARQQGCKLLVAGNTSPRALSLELADLRSRLSWGPVYQLAPGGDDQKIAILQFRAARRGLALSPDAATYIVTRAPRDMQQLLNLLDILDRASLVEQRALSIPFIKQVLCW